MSDPYICELAPGDNDDHTGGIKAATTSPPRHLCVLSRQEFAETTAIVLADMREHDTPSGHVDPLRTGEHRQKARNDALAYHCKRLCGKQDFDEASCKENLDDLLDKR